MGWKFTRRSVLALAASLAALGLGFKSKAATPPRGADPQSGSPLPAPAAAPFDTVVVLMMENRSFDHVLGWLPGANGRQGGLSYLDKDGVAHETWPLGPDFQGCAYEDPDHTWAGIAVQYADGRCDGFLQTRQGRRQISHRLLPRGRAADFERAGEGLHHVRQLFLLDPTWENRLYQITGTTQLDEGWCDFPKEGERRPVLIPTAMLVLLRDTITTSHR
jgi:hypothetical protein